jgi:hypothetical protein
MSDDIVQRVSEDVKLVKIIAIITTLLIVIAIGSQGWF